MPILSHGNLTFYVHCTSCDMLNEDNDDDVSIVINGPVYIRKEEVGG